jgi:serine/threonine protein kinase
VDHENVIKTHSIYQDHSAMYFLQDLMDTTLDSVIHSTAVIGDKAAPLPLPLLLDVCLGIARGMDYLHTLPHPILHRDLKPENLLYHSTPLHVSCSRFAFAFAFRVRFSLFCFSLADRQE